MGHHDRVQRDATVGPTVVERDPRLRWPEPIRNGPPWVEHTIRDGGPLAIATGGVWLSHRLHIAWIGLLAAAVFYACLVGFRFYPWARRVVQSFLEGYRDGGPPTRWSRLLRGGG
jgi:hypothetical protein